jgi:hypothetical protein
MLRLTAGNERWQAVDIALVLGAGMLRALKMLLMLLVLLMRLMLLLMMLLLLLIMLGLILVLFAWIIGLRLARRERFTADMRLLAVALVVALIGPALLALLLLVIGLALSELLLRRGDEPKIMLGVLIIIFRRDRVPGALRVTSKLEVLFRDVRRGPANFYVWPIGLVHSR